jgi:predicted HD phosphohydrolase
MRDEYSLVVQPLVRTPTLLRRTVALIHDERLTMSDNTIAPWTAQDLLDRLALDTAGHGLQCAYELEQSNPDDVELQLAGLFHDLGHGFATEAEHGIYAATAVRPLLGDRVASLIELHVPAKRYLVTVDPAYRAELSPESVHTLALQGGDMTVDEQRAFEAEPHFLAALELRRADERAKVPGRVVPGLDHWAPLVPLARQS